MAGASILAATNIKEALELIAYLRISAAIVDVNLGGHDCSGVCAALTKRSIPFMFYTGCSNADALSDWPHAPSVDNPAASNKLVDAIVELLPYLTGPLARAANHQGVYSIGRTIDGSL